jgi:hypothetical protein
MGLTDATNQEIADLYEGEIVGLEKEIDFLKQTIVIQEKLHTFLLEHEKDTIGRLILYRAHRKYHTKLRERGKGIKKIIRFKRITRIK